MELFLPLAFCTVLVHLAGRFLWFEAFRDFLPSSRYKKIALSFLFLGLLNLILYGYLFLNPTHLVMKSATPISNGGLLITPPGYCTGSCPWQV